MNNINKIGYSQPLLFSKKFLNSQKTFTKALLILGMGADFYLSFDRHFKDAHSFTNQPIKGYNWKTPLKVMSFALTFFILPAIAIAKTAYKFWAINHINFSSNKPIKSILRQPHQKLPAPIPSLKKVKIQESSEKTTPEKTSFIDLKELQKQTEPLPLAEIGPSASPRMNDADKQIIDCLEKLTQNNDDEEKIKILFELHKLSKQDTHQFGTLKGQLMKQVLYKKPIPLKNMLNEKFLGQIIAKNKRRKPAIPDKFYDLSAFVDFAIQRILKRNVKNYHAILAKMAPDQQEILNKNYLILLQKGPVLGNQTHVQAQSDSGRKQYTLVQFGEDDDGRLIMHYVNETDFENKTPHPLEEEKKIDDQQSKINEKNAALLKQLMSSDEGSEPSSVSGTTKININ